MGGPTCTGSYPALSPAHLSLSVTLFPVLSHFGMQLFVAPSCEITANWLMVEIGCVCCAACEAPEEAVRVAHWLPSQLAKQACKMEAV